MRHGNSSQGDSDGSETIRRFIAGLPKAELHVHHVGSASPRIVAELARRHEGATPVPLEEDALLEYFTFRDFAHFVDVYLSVADLIRNPQDVWTLTYEIARDLARQHVRYCELTLTPYASLVRGIPIEAFCEAVVDARGHAEADFDLQLAWCFDIPGEAGLSAADVTLDAALRVRPDGLISFGLGGPESGIPRGLFSEHFAAARAAGLHSVPHAGESTDAQSVWDAVTHLNAERIGHGVRAIDDPELVRHLAEHSIPLEICPTSNIRTGCVASLEQHPLPALVEAGVPVTINSDDPAMFATSLNEEYVIAASLLGLDENGVAALAQASFVQSFLEPGQAVDYVDEIRRYVAAPEGSLEESPTGRPGGRASGGGSVP